MASIPVSHARQEIFDELDNRSKLLRRVTLIGALMIFWLLVVLHSEELIRARWVRLVSWSWLLLAAGVLCLPSNLRNWRRAFRHEPALRINDAGIWSRKWPSLGIMEWDDVQSLYTLTEKGKSGAITISLRNREKYLRRLGWSEFLVLVVGRFWSIFLGEGWREGALTLELALLPLEKTKAVVDPLLAAHGLAPIGPRSGAAG
jgi:hypothetical protein